jgi:hypothetical protein
MYEAHRRCRIIHCLCFSVGGCNLVVVSKMRILTVPILLAVVLLSAPVVWATNESSYKYGYEAGFGTYQCRITEGGCDGPGIATNESSIDCVSIAANSGGQDTNSTACQEGFVDGWTHWCTSHVNSCIQSTIPKLTNPYSVGFTTGKQNATTKPETYDSTDACNYGNWTSDQTYSCLQGYNDGNMLSKYHQGYLQGVQGIELKDQTHTPDFMKGYFKGIQSYWWNRGAAEGYSGLPPSTQNVNYTDGYKDKHPEYLAGYPTAKKCGIDLGKLPVQSNDN